MDLLETTRKMLADQPHGEAVKISRATGLSTTWLSRFRRGEITDPATSRVQRLFDHLNARR